MLLAEIADKTNLLALSLMSETKRPLSVALGGLIGISVVTLIGVLFSSFIQRYIPTDFVVILSGLIFIALGVIGLIFDEEDELEGEIETTKEPSNSIFQQNPLIKSAFMIGLAEFGDKSQIFVISSSLVNDPVAVFLGAVLGMGTIMILTVIFGEAMLKKIPEEKLHFIASILFIVVGIWIIFL